MLQTCFKRIIRHTYTIFLFTLPYGIVSADNIPNTYIPESVLEKAAEQALNNDKRLLFPSEFLQQNTELENSSVNLLIKNSNNIKNEYLNTLEKTSAFNGIYLNGGYSNNIDNDVDEYFYGLEWELYNNGSYDAERKLEKRKLETRLQFLQQLRQMHARQKNSQMNFIRQIETRLDLYITEMQSKIILPYLIKAQEQLKRGFITQIEYREWELRAANVRSKMDYLRNKNFIKINPELFSLLNHIDLERIKDINKLFETAKEKSVAIKMQNLFSSRSEFLPTWKDNLSLSFYLEQRHLKTQLTEDLVGVRLRVPLDFDTNRKKLINLDQKIYVDQVLSIKKRIKQKLEVLVNQFYYFQQRVKHLSQKNSLLVHKINTLLIQKSVGLPSLDHTPEKDIPLHQIQHIESLHNVLQARLKLYAIIVELEEIVMPKKIIDLFE
ncbi:MAG: hypothetical protein QM500_07995 [Methylococcales bacterium]